MKMIITDHKTSLAIECSDPNCADTPYEVSIDSGNCFKAHCHGQFFIVGPTLRASFMKFENRELGEIIIKTNCDGFIRLIRQQRGGVTLQYQFRDLYVDDLCQISGTIDIDGEWSTIKLKELRETIFSKVAD